MSSSLKIAVTPAVLRWAREEMELSIDQAAEKAEITSKELKQWEQEETEIALPVLNKLRGAYKKTLAVFLLSTPPTRTKRPTDHRTFENSRPSKTTNLLLAIRRTQRMQELYAETLVYENKSLPRFKLFTRSEVSPRKLAEYARGDFGLTLETQFGWENERVALTELVRLIESKGILVFQMTFNPKDARGFVLPDKNPPVIVMSASDSIRGRIFTLLHEYGHLLLGEEGISDWDDRNPVESFCNKFAADFLIPSGSLESHPAFLSFKNGIETDITQTIRNLVKDFKVSTEVILTALLKLGTISSYFYEEERARIAKEVEEYKKRKKRGGPTPAVNCVAQRGVPYVSAVISANKEGKIGLADVSDYLNVRQKHLPQIEGLILKKEKAYAAEAF